MTRNRRSAPREHCHYADRQNVEYLSRWRAIAPSSSEKVSSQGLAGDAASIWREVGDSPTMSPPEEYNGGTIYDPPNQF